MKVKIALMMIVISALVISISRAQDETWIDTVPDANIYALVDDGDYFWVMSNYGLSKLHKTTGEIDYYQYKIPGLENFPMTSIALADNGHVWIGTDGGGVGVYDGSGWTIYNFENGNLANNTVNAITSDHLGNIWFGTNYGLTMFDGENWTNYFTTNSDLPNNGITALTCDETGIVWIGTEKGCAKYDNGNFTVYNKTNSELPDDIVNTIACDSQDSILIGTNGGLAVVQGETWNVYTTSNSDMTSNIVSCISVDSNNTIYLGVGRNEFNYSLVTFNGDSWAVFKTDSSGLPSNNVQTLVSDDHGNTWIGTDSGLVFFDGNNWEMFDTGMTGGLGSWSPKANMPTARVWLKSSVVNGRIYAMGGSGSANLISANEEYDPATDTWTRKTRMQNDGNSGLSLCTINETIYVFGSWSGSNVPPSAVSVYDTNTDTWSDKPDMPIEKCMPGVAVVKGKIYVIGGGLAGGEVSTSSVEEYDHVNETWATKTDMPQARSGFGISVVKDKIYVIGGYCANYTTDILSSVIEYDPETDTWASKSDMPTARFYLSTSVVNDKIYAIGGWPNGMSSVEEYDPATDTWKRLLDMPTARSALTTAAVDGKIYAIGGSAATSYKNATMSKGTIFSIVEVFDPGTGSSPAIVENSAPTGFKLSQNYPNPFNPRTTIIYNLDQQSMVNLTIYDLLGRKVATLVDEVKTPGSYTVNWNADGFASGVYFYRIQTDNTIDLMQKMLLLK